MVVVEEQTVDEEEQHQDARRHEEVARDIIGAADDDEESGELLPVDFYFHVCKGSGFVPYHQKKSWILVVRASSISSPGPASAGSLPLRPGGVRTVLVRFLVNIHRVAVHRVCSLWVWFRIRQDDWFLFGVADGGEIRYHHPFGIVLLPIPLPWYDDDGHARRYQVFECGDVVVGQPNTAMADAPSHRPGRTGAVNANLRRPRHAQSDKPRSEHPFLLRSLPLVVGVEPVGTVIYILHGEESFGRAVVPLLVLCVPNLVEQPMA